MGIMNLVWPVTALFGTVWIVWQYIRYGREAQGEHQTPFAIAVSNGALHCGSGCTPGDICAEWLAFLAPGVAVALGWRTLFSDKMFAIWVLDYIFAYGFGIIFQYFSLAPMRHLSSRTALSPPSRPTPCP